MTPEQMIDDQLKNLETIAKNSCFYSANHVPQGTRKFSGQARASTNMSIGSADLSVILAANYGRDAINGELDLATRKFKSVSSRIKTGDTVHVSNNLDYINKLEYKYGDLMFSKAVRMWQEDVQRAVNDTK